MTAHPVPLKTLRGMVEAPVDAVAGVLFDLGPDGRSPIMPPGQINQIEAHDGAAFTVTIDQAGSRVTARVNPDARTVTIQGQWWYRADVTLTPHQDGCLVTQQIFNVARHLRWGVRFVARKPLAASPDAFTALLQALGQRLGRPAHPLN